MEIYLIRHGEKENSCNHESVRLTGKGFQQAELTGMLLCRHSIERIYCSNMLRAVQTAEAINKHLNTKIEIVPELREIHMGICEIGGWESLEKNYPEYMEEFNRHETDMRYPPDGECGTDVWERVKGFLDILVTSKYKKVALVTHGGVIKVILAGILGLEQQKRFCFGSPLKNCSISIIKYDHAGRSFSIHCYNNYTHIEKIS